MLFYHLLFFFVAVVTKLILAMVTIYWLLPSDRVCSQCDEGTLFIRPPAALRIFQTLTFGRIQWRWCPRCGSEGLARAEGSRGYLTHIPIQEPTPARADHHIEP